MRRMNSAKSMRGLSVSGWLVSIIAVVVFATAGVKIVPSMLDFNTVKSLINNVLSDNKIGLKSVDEISKEIDRRFLVNSITVLKAQDIKIDKVDGVLIVELDYEVRENFFENVDFVMTYKHEFKKNIR
ncbi:MAG: DUF4845 domain-containing protein [Gammaproteobacteria bacterium]|jgi:hypothetical protein|nr:DUF4845 domain-containing protein [Gammaproteobacteria bacterium]MBQ0774532.1 DUF4845 domain-containing protein [Gammaproteobacteria bacterium]